MIVTMALDMAKKACSSQRLQSRRMQTATPEYGRAGQFQQAVTEHANFLAISDPAELAAWAAMPAPDESAKQSLVKKGNDLVERIVRSNNILDNRDGLFGNSEIEQQLAQNTRELLQTIDHLALLILADAMRLAAAERRGAK